MRWARKQQGTLSPVFDMFDYLSATHALIWHIGVLALRVWNQLYYLH